MSVPESILANVQAWNPFHLSAETDASSPESATSAGAQFLSSVRTSTLEAIGYVDDDDLSRLSDAMRDVGTDHDIADGAVPIYTHDLWATFVDLGAYNVDLSDYGDAESLDMTRGAQVALYAIAQQLVNVIVENVETEVSDRVDVGIDRASERGEEEGMNAAGWFVQYNVSGPESARRILEGLTDGDPELLDSLPSPDLSGQLADVTTVRDLLADADLVGLSDASDVAQQLADAYETAFSEAVEENIAEACRYQLPD